MNKYSVEIRMPLNGPMPGLDCAIGLREINAINHRGAFDIAKAKWPKAVVLSTQKIR